VVMRAVVLPPDARRVVFRYEPFVLGRYAAGLYALGVLLLLGGFVGFLTFKREWALR